MQIQIETRTRRVRRVVEITEHRCWVCGEWFETKRADAVYCPPPKPCKMRGKRAGIQGPRLLKAAAKK